MPTINYVATPMTIWPLIFVVDVSEKTQEEKEAVNQFMLRVPELLCEIERENHNAYKTVVGLITYADNPWWQTRSESGKPRFVWSEEFSWDDIDVQFKGKPNFGNALRRVQASLNLDNLMPMLEVYNTSFGRPTVVFVGTHGVDQLGKRFFERDCRSKASCLCEYQTIGVSTIAKDATRAEAILSSWSHLTKRVYDAVVSYHDTQSFKRFATPELLSGWTVFEMNERRLENQKRKRVETNKLSEDIALEAYEKPKKAVLPLIYVIDVSESMAGDRINAINEAMRQSTSTLRDISSKSDDEIRISVLSFSSDIQWVTSSSARKPTLVGIDEFNWHDLSAGGEVNLGRALQELNKTMRTSALFCENVTYKAPVIVFLSNAPATDEWEQALNEADGNRWFRHSCKICMAIGNDADEDMLALVAGRNGRPLPEAVIGVTDTDIFKRLITVRDMPQ